MNISEDVNILNGLQVCRDKMEAKHYLKAHGICMNEHELDALKSHCYTENEENTLTANQLNKVAGGNPPLAIMHEPVHVGSPNPAAKCERSLKKSIDMFNASLAEHGVERNRVVSTQRDRFRRAGSLSDIIEQLNKAKEEFKRDADAIRQQAIDEFNQKAKVIVQKSVDEFIQEAINICQEGEGSHAET